MLVDYGEGPSKERGLGRKSSNPKDASGRFGSKGTLVTEQILDSSSQWDVERELLDIVTQQLCMVCDIDLVALNSACQTPALTVSLTSRTVLTIMQPISEFTEIKIKPT